MSVDLSGVNVNTQFLQELMGLLKELPKTKDEAVALYHNVTLKLANYLVSNLPAVEQKAASVAMWAVNELQAEVVKCLPSLNCAAKSALPK